MTATVAVVGGGYGGITAAQALDEVADVVLVDPKDAFVHNVASLRAAVDASWAERIFFSYDRLLKNGRVMRDWAVSVDSGGISLASGRRVDADFVVLATGTTYPYPAKIGSNHVDAAKRRILATTEALSKADRVLLLGAGPVGLEFAGEIAAAWPRKTVTIVDYAMDVLSGGFVSGFREDLQTTLRRELRRQLVDMGVELLLGSSLRHELPIPAAELGAFTATTWAGRSVTADIWFQCFGRKPASGFLAPGLTGARRRDFRLRVTPQLRLEGHRNIFAIGDVNATAALDTAVVAMEQATLVAEHIRAHIQGGAEPAPYRPSQPFLLIPLGPKGGASYSPDHGILDAATTAEFKSADLFVGKYSEIFGLNDRGHA